MKYPEQGLSRLTLQLQEKRSGRDRRRGCGLPELELRLPARTPAVDCSSLMQWVQDEPGALEAGEVLAN